MKPSFSDNRFTQPGISVLLGILCAGTAWADDLAWLDSYNIVWTTPSSSSSESMPCGGGDLGLNVWVENGDLLFYIDRSGSFDENNSALKLGRVRIKLEPNAFAAGGSFRQELRLREGCVQLEGKCFNVTMTAN